MLTKRIHPSRRCVDRILDAALKDGRAVRAAALLREIAAFKAEEHGAALKAANAGAAGAAGAAAGRAVAGAGAGGTVQ